MTDPKDTRRPPPKDIDWDQALAEWEGESFEPEAGTEIPAPPQPDKPSSRRL